MANDFVFRWILVAAFVTVLPFALYHRIRSNATGEKLDRRQEGLFIMITLRGLGLIRVLGVFAFMINPAWMAWSSLPLPLWLRWMGAATGALGVILLFWTFHKLGKNITDTVVTRKDHELVTTGPYRWVRHPFYCAFGLGIVADSLVVANWFLAVTGLFLFGLIVLRTDKEEENLEKRFGDQYLSYKENTGRFFPRLFAVSPSR